MGSCATGCVAGASALLPEVAWSCKLLLVCCWGGGNWGASGGGGACRCSGQVGGRVPSANSQPCEKLRAKTFLDEVFHASGPSITTRPRGNGCAGRQRSLAAPPTWPQPPTSLPSGGGRQGHLVLVLVGYSHAGAASAAGPSRVLACRCCLWRQCRWSLGTRPSRKMPASC